MFKYYFLRYILNPTRYSISGLRFAMMDRAFRFEIILGIFLLPVLITIFFENKLSIILILIGYFFILTTELINCAIEKTIDSVFKNEKNFLAKQIKDIASSAVFISLINFFFILVFACSNIK